MSSEVSPEFWLECDFLITKACLAWAGQGVHLLEVKGDVEALVEVDVDAEKFRNRERGPLRLFGRRRRARKRRHQCLAKPGESKHRAQ